jgi:hypothetical protein
MKVQPTPPHLFLKLFRWYCHPKLVDHIEGDLLEDYGVRIKKSGKRKADIRFMIDVLLLFRPGIIRPTEGHKNLNNYGMYKSYFKIGWRNILRNKGFAFINIGGLAVGMACFSIIVLMEGWLEGFAYQNEIGWKVFVVSAFTLLLITLATVSFQSIKAALVNPVKSLRAE